MIKKIREISDILQNKNFTTKVKIFMSSSAAGDDYDPYEDNLTFTNLNPITIKAYVRELTPETAFWKQYGLHQNGMKEILTEDKYKSMFENASKIEIEDIEYQVFREGTGNNVSIVKRPQKLLRVIVTRNG